MKSGDFGDEKISDFEGSRSVEESGSSIEIEKEDSISEEENLKNSKISEPSQKTSNKPDG